MTAYDEAAGRILEQLKEILQSKGHAVLGIVGGRTTEGLFRALTDRAGESDGTVHVFWLDERLSGEKNFTQALPFLETLSGKVRTEWHPVVSTTVEGAEDEIRALEQLLSTLGGFDIVIASAGEDGHIASLFPGRTLEARPGYAIVRDSPKPPSDRVTATPPLLLAAEYGHLFFIGESKRDAYERFSDDSCPVQKCPAKLLKELDLHVYTDMD